MDISDILKSLKGLRRRIRTAYLLHGLGATFIRLSGILVFLFAADYFLDLPATVRLVLLGTAAILLFATIYKKIVFPLGVPITDDDVALSVERVFPQLGEKVISAVQLSRRKDPSFEALQSTAMVEHTIKEAVSAMKGLRLAPVVRSGGGFRSIGLGVLLFGALAIVGFLNEDLSSIWMNRVFGGSLSWPQRTRLQVLDPPLGDILVARGENFLIKVRVTGDVPSRVGLHFHFTASDEDGEADCMRIDDNIFQYVFPNVLNDFSFTISAGDAETQPRTVKVLVPPKVTGVRLRMTFPPHTKRLSPEPDSWSQRTGNIKAPVGTKVYIETDFSTDVAEAHLRFSKKGLARVALSLADDRGVGSFEVSAHMTYSLHLTGKNGLSNRIHARYTIRAVPDQRPLLKLAWPRYNEQVTAQAVLPVRGLLRDDFGIASAAVLLRRTGTKESTSFPVTLPDTKFGEKEVKFSLHLELAGLTLPDDKGKTAAMLEGATFLLALEALDFRPPEGNRAVTREIQIEVVSRAELERIVESRMMQIKESISRMKILQEKVLEKMKDLDRALDEAQIWDRGDLENLLGCEVSQRRLTRDAQRVHAEFLHVLDTVIYNKLGDPDYIRKLREMAEMVDLAAHKSPEALKSIEKSRMALARNLQKKSASDTMEAQQAVIEILDDLLTRMGRWEDYNEIIRAVRELREMQGKIRKRTDDLTKKKNK
jgi:hypothetical protein